MGKQCKKGEFKLNKPENRWFLNRIEAGEDLFF